MARRASKTGQPARSRAKSSQRQAGTATTIASPRWIAAALAAITLAVYAQVWRFDFITLDDPIFVSTNPHVLAGLTPGGIKWAFDRFYFANWMPMTWLSLMVDGTLYEAWAGGYHLTNLLLHVANVLLLFHVQRKATGKDLLSALVAGLFAVHPIQAESVAWISERKGVLCMFFGLLCLSSYVSYARRPRITPYLLSLAFFVFCLMSKQALVTLPCVLLLLDYWPLGRLDWPLGRPSLRVLAEKVPFFAASAVFSVVAVRAQSYGLTVRSLESVPFGLRMANAILAYAAYLQKALVPWNLGVYYPYSTEVSLVHVGLALALLVGLCACAIAFRRSYPFFTVGWFWFLGTLIPMIGLVQVGVQQMADRYAYFSFIGLYLAAAGFVTSRRAALAIVTGVAVAGFFQVGYWRDTLTLATHTARVTEDNAFLHFVLGDALVAEGKAEEALEQYRQGVQAAPGDAGFHCRLGQTLLRFNELADARHEFQIALALDDNLSGAHSGLGWIWMAQKDTAAAKREFERALEADPADQENYLHLALLHKNLRELSASNEYCRGALAINDQMLAAHRLLAENLEELGSWSKAAVEWQRVLSVDPNDPEARQRLEKAARRAESPASASDRRG